METPLSPTTDSQARTFVQEGVASVGLVLTIIGAAFIVMRVAAAFAVGSPERLLDASMVVPAMSKNDNTMF